MKPAIFVGGYASTGGVMDYCDAVHGDPASRDAKFKAVQIFQITGTGIMLAAGSASSSRCPALQVKAAGRDDTSPCDNPVADAR
ncbi:hypothetical protein ACFQZZ_15150 [Nocardia sp. GCM10030253]|uniref:hypothetical protein n=1 Tax=Nocardia sp. GCM10030253 TaxID=3273404 RepID=UPI00363DDEC6